MRKTVHTALWSSRQYTAICKDHCSLFCWFNSLRTPPYITHLFTITILFILYTSIMCHCDTWGMTVYKANVTYTTQGVRLYKWHKKSPQTSCLRAFCLELVAGLEPATCSLRKPIRAFYKISCHCTKPNYTALSSTCHFITIDIVAYYFTAIVHK